MRLGTSRHLTLLGALAVIAACRHGPPNVPPSIGILKLATLGSHGGPGALRAEPTSVARDSHARYIVALGLKHPSPPLVFDSAGKFLDSLGPTGDGPGEFQTPGTIIVGPEDSIYVFDAGRISVRTSDGTFARTIKGIPYVNGNAIRLPDGSFVLNDGYDLTPNTLLLLSADGHPVRSFARAPAPEGIGSYWEDHVLSRVDGGTFWTADKSYSALLELWDTTGHLVRSVTPDLSWYRPYSHGVWVDPTHPPSPTISGVWRDASGRIWILGIAANPHWELGITTRTGPNGLTTRDSIGNPAKFYDVMLDEVDADSGTVIAERRFSEFGSGLVIAPGLIGVTRRDTDGWWYVDVYYVMSNEGHD